MLRLLVVMLALGLVAPAVAAAGRCDKFDPLEIPVPPPDTEGGWVAGGPADPTAPTGAATPPPGAPGSAGPGRTEAAAPQVLEPVAGQSAAPSAGHAAEDRAALAPLLLVPQAPALDVRQIAPERGARCLRRGGGGHCPILAMRVRFSSDPALRVVADLDRRGPLSAGAFSAYATRWSRPGRRARTLRFAHGFTGPLLGPGEYRLTLQAVDPQGAVRASRVVGFTLG